MYAVNGVLGDPLLPVKLLVSIRQQSLFYIYYEYVILQVNGLLSPISILKWTCSSGRNFDCILYSVSNTIEEIPWPQNPSQYCMEEFVHNISLLMSRTYWEGENSKALMSACNLKPLPRG